MTEQLNESISPLEVNAEAVNPSAGFPAEELQTLGELEETIAKGEGSFVETGLSLATIRKGNLHLEAGYKTFEAYCRGRWGFTRQRACQLIGGAETAKHLETIVNTVSPTNEGQVRQLAGRSLDEAAEIWKLANAMASGAPVTGSLVKKAIKTLLGEVPKPEKSVADVIESILRSCRNLANSFGDTDLSGLEPNAKSDLTSVAKALVELASKAGCWPPPAETAKRSKEELIKEARVFRRPRLQTFLTDPADLQTQK